MLGFCIQPLPKHDKSTAECFWKHHPACFSHAIHFQAASTEGDLAGFCWMPLLAQHISTAAQDKVTEWQDWICPIASIYRKGRQNQNAAAAYWHERGTEGVNWPAAVPPGLRESWAVHSASLVLTDGCCPTDRSWLCVPRMVWLLHAWSVLFLVFFLGRVYLPGRQISSYVHSFLEEGIQVTFLLYCKHFWFGFFSMILREALFIERRGEQSGWGSQCFMNCVMAREQWTSYWEQNRVTQSINNEVTWRCSWFYQVNGDPWLSMMDTH